jgi:hypothetical protein
VGLHDAWHVLYFSSIPFTLCQGKGKLGHIRNAGQNTVNHRKQQQNNNITTDQTREMRKTFT